MQPPSLTAPEDFIGLLRRAPMLDALGDGPLDRQTLEARLDISRATSHRFTRWLGDRGLIERLDGAFHLTELGEVVAAEVDDFESTVTTAFHLGPVLAALDDTRPRLPLDAFGDAVVTTPSPGDPYGPMTRYAALVRRTSTLRGFNTWMIAPTYMDEIQDRILEGMETDLVDPRAVVEDLMENYPERCVQVCVSGNLTIRLHESLPFGLAILDDRVGIAVGESGSETLGAFIDTDSPVAREWAEAVYESYRDESVLLEEFTKTGLRKALSPE